MPDRVVTTPLLRVSVDACTTDQDLVAAEAPLSLSVRDGRGRMWPLGTLMRTPGDDHDLARGLLYAEGLIRTADDIVAIDATPSTEGSAAGDTAIAVTLAPHIEVDADALSRATMATSACGLCGRLTVRSANALRRVVRAPDEPAFSAAFISALPNRLRQAQPVFAETGGLHAAGLFDLAGTLLAIAEDVGRHNAVDKLVGRALAQGRLPAHHAVMVVSGRVAFEIVEKAAMAGVPALVAVGAPSSLAIDAARATNMTLMGFARDGRFNVYAGVERLRRNG
jgi:FdhD protein